MSYMMMLAFGRKAASSTTPPMTVTKTFTTNERWVAPAGVSVLDTAVGYGGRGEDGSSTTVHQYYFRSYDVTYDDNGNETQRNYLSQSGNMSGSKPNDYCDPKTTNPNGRVSSICYSFFDSSYDTQTNPPTQGPSATGFGKVFAGGVGSGQPSNSGYSNVPITPNATYQVVVPDGGMITITYKV